MPRSVHAMVQGMAFVALNLVYHRIGVFGLEAVTDWAAFLLGGTLIVAGIAEEVAEEVST